MCLNPNTHIIHLNIYAYPYTLLVDKYFNLNHGSMLDYHHGFPVYHTYSLYGYLRIIFPRHTLPNLDQMYIISEVIILNNDQNNIKKTTSTNKRINSKINQHLTPFVDWCYCLREVLFYKVCLFVVYKFVLHGKNFLAKQIREQSKTQPIFAGKTISCQTDKGTK